MGYLTDEECDEIRQENNQLKEDEKLNIEIQKQLTNNNSDLRNENINLKQKLEKITMDNCILEDDKTELNSFLFMNDVDDLEQLDKEFNSLKQKLEEIKEVNDSHGEGSALNERIDKILEEKE